MPDVTPADAVTVGVEEEFLLVDPETRRLVPRARAVVGEASVPDDAGVEFELQLAQVETGTAVCRTLQEVRTAVVDLRRTVAAAAERSGCRIAAAATHPFSPTEDSRVTPKAAYLRLERNYQTVAREQLVCGCHVHVGFSDPDMAIQVMNRVRASLPTVAALAANSPFWLGEDTGYASFRAEIWRRWPMAGTPETFASRAEYDRLIAVLLDTGAIDDPRRIYWDVRPSSHLDTLEFRVTDVCVTIDETVMIAGVVRALARTAYEAELADQPFVDLRPELLRAAGWRAARYGLEGELIDLESEKSVPAREAVRSLLARLRPVLEEAGDWEEIDGLADAVLAGGTGAARQRQVLARGGDLAAVVDWLMAETPPG